MTFMQRTVIAIFVLAITTASLIAIAQAPFANARFEYGHPRKFSGVVHATPVPHLDGILLVGPGKHGLDVRSKDGRCVTLKGTLIERDGMQMIEVEGEIVDSKCWLGVMNPGAGKVHRGCASLCIRGGVPPMLVARDGRKLVITGVDPIALLPYVGEEVTLRGEVARFPKKN